MSDSTTLSLDRLPLEILHAILYHIDIPDILRIRRVSRYLNEVTRYGVVWSNAYHTAQFPHPPGPFPTQSIHQLENALITNFRISQNLHGYLGDSNAQRKGQAVKLRAIQAGLHLRVSLIFGRFVLIAFKEEIRCYDLNVDETNDNTGGSIIYRTTTGRILRSFDCVSAIDVEGRPFACAILNEATRTTRRISIHSLHVGEQSKMTLNLLHQSEYSAFDVAFVDLGPRVIVIHGRVGANRDTDWQFIVLDVHTRSQFLLPLFALPAQQAAEPQRRVISENTKPMSISTSTHVVLAKSFYNVPGGWSTFFEAYALPTSPTHHHLTPTSTSLSPSHRAIIPGINVRLHGTLLLHDTVFDSSTQDALIAIRVHTFEPSNPLISISQHGILRLSSIHTMRDREVGTVTVQLLGPFSHSRMLFVHPSFNGTGRVFYSGTDRIIAALEYNLHASGNSDGEHGAKITDYPCVLHFPTPHSPLDYDPYTGRLCTRYITGHDSTIEIFDFFV